MCIIKLLSAIIFCSMSEQRKDINSLLFSLSPIKLQAFTKFSLSLPKKNSSCGGTHPSSEASFISSSYIRLLYLQYLFHLILYRLHSRFV